MDHDRERFTSLDGLRGVAALVVVVFHVAISTRGSAAIYELDHRRAMSPLDFVLNYTPVRLLWAGSEAVVVFYVLSGFVLALPFARHEGQRWSAFYPRRLVRLYLPAAGSLVFAWLTTLAVHRHVIAGASSWLNSHATEPNGLKQVVFGSSLLTGWGGLNTSLWSLRFEVVFSVLLPAFILLASRLPRWVWPKVGLVLLAGLLWPLVGFFYPDAVYLGVFALGVLMAFNLEALKASAARISRPIWWVIASLAVLLLLNSWLIAGVDLASRLRSVWIAPASIGAALLVFTAAFCPAAKVVLQTPLVRWLGLISFSLYLVQEPIVVGLAFATGGSLPFVLVLPPALVLSIGLGWLFYRFVERPSHRLARRLGRPVRSAVVVESPSAVGTTAQSSAEPVSPHV